MSYGNQNQNNESSFQDPNSFSNTGGRQNDQNSNEFGNTATSGFGGISASDPAATGNYSQDQSGRDNLAGGQGQFGRSDVGGGDGEFGRTDNSSGGQGRGNQFDTGTQDAYQSGNTTDYNTPGTGGNARSTGRGVGASDSSPNYDDSNVSGGQNNDSQSGGKPSMGDRLKGNAEKLAGRVTGNEGLKERGQERKTGDYDGGLNNDNQY